MPKKADLKAIAYVVLGVMIAGYAMNKFSDIAIVDEAATGFGA